MAGVGPATVLRNYFATLLAVIAFPVQWVRCWRIADRHAEDDPRGRTKVLVAIVVGLVLAGGIGTGLALFRADQIEGMYDSLEDRLRAATLEQEYQDQVTIIGQKEGQITILEANLAAARAAGDADLVAELNGTLADAEGELAEAEARQAQLEQHHQLFLGLEPRIEDQQDGEVQVRITAFNEGSGVPEKDLIDEERVGQAFATKDDARADLDRFLLYWPVFGWFALAGVFWAPLVFATGSILKRAWRPSETVGYRPYPGGAAGWFLLFGAFGVPAILFAAWTFADMQQRAAEGQISL